jgi:hypothetical protein
MGCGCGPRHYINRSLACIRFCMNAGCRDSDTAWQQTLQLGVASVFGVKCYIRAYKGLSSKQLVVMLSPLHHSR